MVMIVFSDHVQVVLEGGKFYGLQLIEGFKDYV